MQIITGIFIAKNKVGEGDKFRSEKYNMQFLLVPRELERDILERTSANNVRKREKFKFKSSSGRAEFGVLKGTIAQNANIVDIERKKTKHNRIINFTK